MADKETRFQVNIVGKESGLDSIDAAFKRMGLSAEQAEAQMKMLEKIGEEDALPQHIRDVEVEMRRMGYTTQAVKKMVDSLNATAQENAESHLSRYDRAMNWFSNRGRKAEGGEREGGERKAGEHEGGGHGWEGISGHISILRDHFGELRETVGETRESLADMFPMLAGFGAVGSAAGLVELIHHTAEEQAQLEAMSKQLGIAANQLEAFHYAANLSDVSTESMDKAIGRLGVSMQAAVSGHNKLDAAIFHRMGIALKDAHGQMVPIPKVLEEVSQALKNTRDPAMRLYVAQELFGKSGREMLPLLIQGREHLEDLTAEAERLGPALTDLDRDHLDQFNDAWKQAQYVSESFMTKLGADLAPVMTPLLDDFTKFVAANKDWIARDVSSEVGKLTTALKGFDWHKAAQDAEAFAKGIGVVASDVNAMVQVIPGGWKTVAAGFAAYKIANPFFHMIGDGMRVVKIGGELAGIAAEKLPQAFARADLAVGSFSSKAIAALNGVGAAISIIEAAKEFGNKPAQINPTQKKIQDSFHLQPDQPLTKAQIAALDRAAQPGQPSVADPFIHGPENPLSVDYDYNLRHIKHDQGANSPARTALAELAAKLAALHHHSDLLSTDSLISPAALPASLPAAPRGPFGRFAPSPVADASRSTVHVQIEFQNTPPGTKVSATTTGGVSATADVGYNTLMSTVAP